MKAKKKHDGRAERQGEMFFLRIVIMGILGFGLYAGFQHFAVNASFSSLTGIGHTIKTFLIVGFLSIPALVVIVFSIRAIGNQVQEEMQIHRSEKPAPKPKEESKPKARPAPPVPARKPLLSLRAQIIKEPPKSNLDVAKALKQEKEQAFKAAN